MDMNKNWYVEIYFYTMSSSLVRKYENRSAALEGVKELYYDIMKNLKANGQKVIEHHLGDDNAKVLFVGGGFKINVVER